LKFSVKIVRTDGTVAIDIQDREIDEDEIFTELPKLVADFSAIVGEDIIPYMAQGVALAQIASLLGYPPIMPVEADTGDLANLDAPVAQSAEATDLKSV
jgi:hypothetical protein